MRMTTKTTNNDDCNKKMYYMYVLLCILLCNLYQDGAFFNGIKLLQSTFICVEAQNTV